MNIGRVSRNHASTEEEGKHRPLWNIKRIKACMSRFSSGAYTYMRSLSAVNHSTTQRHCAQPQQRRGGGNWGYNSDSDNDNVISVELVSVRFISPSEILRGVSGGTTPGVRVGAVCARTFLWKLLSMSSWAGCGLSGVSCSDHDGIMI